MRLVATPEALEFVRRRGGRLFLRTAKSCCSPGVRWLLASTEEDERRRFERDPYVGELELYFPEGSRLPEELGLRLRRFPRAHVEADWNGCAWIV